MSRIQNHSISLTFQLVYILTDYVSPLKVIGWREQAPMSQMSQITGSNIILRGRTVPAFLIRYGLTSPAITHWNLYVRIMCFKRWGFADFPFHADLLCPAGYFKYAFKFVMKKTFCVKKKKKTWLKLWLHFYASFNFWCCDVHFPIINFIPPHMKTIWIHLIKWPVR